MSDRPVEIMQMYLSEFSVDDVLGIYGANKDHLAARMRYLHPAAAASFRLMNAEKQVRCSDMFRTPEGSLLARQRKNGRGLRPGWSGHNYGFSIDIDVGWVKKTHGFKTKEELDLWMVSHGWYCHNILGYERPYEAWHYNYFGDEAEHYLSFRADNRTSTWSKPVAKKIDEYYGHWWKNADVVSVQVALHKVGFYGGAFDGDAGDLFKQAVRGFQKGWDLSADGIAGPVTTRTLMLVSSERFLTDEPC